MDSMQLNDIALYSDMYQPCIFTISSFIQCTNISTIDESQYKRGKTSFEYANVRCLKSVNV